MKKRIRKTQVRTLVTESLEIKGLTWKLSVQRDEEYIKHHGGDSEGITVGSQRHIYIKESALYLEVVLHELGHAYFQSCLTYTANLNEEDIEEVFCEIIANHGSQMVTDARRYTKYLKEIIRDKDED